MNAITKHRKTLIFIAVIILPITIFAAIKVVDNWMWKKRQIREKSQDVVEQWAKIMIETTKWTRSTSPAHMLPGKAIHMFGFEEFGRLKGTITSYDDKTGFTTTKEDIDKSFIYHYSPQGDEDVIPDQVASIIYVERKDGMPVLSYESTRREGYECEYHLSVFDVKNRQIVAEKYYQVSPPPEVQYPAFADRSLIRDDRVRGSTPVAEIKKYLASLPVHQ